MDSTKQAHHVPESPSRTKLAWSSLAALLVSAVLLVTVILPAEYMSNVATCLANPRGLNSGTTVTDVPSFIFVVTAEALDKPRQANGGRPR